MGYYQIELEEPAKPFTAFVAQDDHNKFNRLPFGLEKVSSVFQGMMNEVVARANPDVIIVYLDDVIIPSKTAGVQILEPFLKILKHCELTLRYDKCNFFVANIDILGYRIDDTGIRPGKSKLIAI